MKEEVWKDVVEYEGLYQVSSFGNIRSIDREVRHSNQRGEKGNGAKLTDVIVVQIKSRITSGEKGADLAKEFDVSEATVSRVKLGRSWGHTYV